MEFKKESKNKMISEFFNAKTIAVIGAAREAEKAGNIVFRNLIANKALKVFPVNPNSPSILGEISYSSVLKIDGKIDLAIIVVPSQIVPSVLNDCGKKKIKNIIIVSAGFSESGNFKLEEQIKKIGEKYKMQILGPNVLGIISPHQNLNASFFKGIPPEGNIAFISQSGAIGTAILDKAIKERTCFSGFVSIGNSMQLDFSDFIEYYGKDEKTKAIVLYIESLKEGRGRRFIDVCREVSKKKPILAIKSGKTEAGKSAAFSHTAALASEQGVYESIFKQAGIVELEGLREIFNLSDLLCKIDREKLGKRACIVTNAGGLGVLASDTLSNSGISLPSVPEKIKKKLIELHSLGHYNNPIDLLGDAKADRYSQTLSLLDNETFFDFFIVLLTPQFMTQSYETAQVLLQIKKPIIAVFSGGSSIERAKLLLKEKIPMFDDVSDLSILGKI